MRWIAEPRSHSPGARREIALNERGGERWDAVSRRLRRGHILVEASRAKESVVSCFSERFAVEVSGDIPDPSSHPAEVTRTDVSWRLCGSKTKNKARHREAPHTAKPPRTELAHAEGRRRLQIELSVSGKTLTDNSSGS